MNQTSPILREDFRYACDIATRWMDQDPYDHVNNVVYYSWFDTAVNSFLIREGLLDPATSAIIGLVVESGCRYFRAVSFPDPITAMVRVVHLGTSSVRYEVGIFSDGHDEAAALGHFVHVYVDRESRRPAPIPPAWRAALERLRV